MAVLKGKFSVDDALDSIDLTFKNYTPTIQAFTFFNTMRIFFGEDFEIPSPKFHYFVVDMLFGNVRNEMFPYSDEINKNIRVNKSRIAIIAARGLAKSTVTTFFYPIYCAITGTTPVTGPLSHLLILSDSAKGGARDQAILLGNAFDRSEWAKTHFEKIRWTETELEVIRNGDAPVEKRHMLIKFKGAQALSLDSKLFGENGYSSIAQCKIGDRIFGADGKLCTIIDKSEIFYKPMYKITLKDGRSIKVSEDHINSVVVRNTNNKWNSYDVLTTELLEMPMWITNNTTGYKTPRIWIKNNKPLEYEHKNLPIDPYTLGLILGDGYYHQADYSVKLTGNEEDMEFYYTQIPYEIGYIDKSKGSNHTATIKGLSQAYRTLGLDRCKAHNKYISQLYKVGSIAQRLALLQGLIDTDGTVADGKRGVRFMTTSMQLRDDVMDLVRSLGGSATWSISQKAHETETILIGGMKTKRNYDLYKVYIHLNMMSARLPRKANKIRLDTDKQRIAIVNIERIEDEESQCIKVDNVERQFITTDYVRTHNSGGIRSGSRNPVTMDRYAIIIADDVIKNEAEAYSDVIMHNVKTALDSDALNAMRSKKTQFILINTPFHKNDPVYTSIENGIFTPLVVPICKEISEELEEEEFIGAWPDMHDYNAVMERYLNSKGNNNLRAFMQELMLRVTSEEDRMIKDDMVQWYSRSNIEKFLGAYNLYMTTDLTSSSEGTGDYSAVYLWAVGSNQDWFMLDMSLKKQGIMDQYNEIIKMVQKWAIGRYLEVGIEVDGQQRLNIYALKELMSKRNVYFNFARQKGAPYGKEGISSRAAGGTKFDRFRVVYPLFQGHKIYFPTELKETPDMKELLNEMKYVSFTGFKSRHDDGLDGLSQLVMLDVTYPTEVISFKSYDETEKDNVSKTGSSIYGSWPDTDGDEDRDSIVF